MNITLNCWRIRCTCRRLVMSCFWMKNSDSLDMSRSQTARNQRLCVASQALLDYTELAADTLRLDNSIEKALKNRHTLSLNAAEYIDINTRSAPLHCLGIALFGAGCQRQGQAQNHPEDPLDLVREGSRSTCSLRSHDFLEHPVPELIGLQPTNQTIQNVETVLLSIGT